MATLVSSEPGERHIVTCPAIFRFKHIINIGARISVKFFVAGAGAARVSNTVLPTLLAQNAD